MRLPILEKGEHFRYYIFFFFDDYLILHINMAWTGQVPKMKWQIIRKNKQVGLVLRKFWYKSMMTRHKYDTAQHETMPTPTYDPNNGYIWQEDEIELRQPASW